MDFIYRIKSFAYIIVFLWIFWIGVNYSLNHPYIRKQATIYLYDKIKENTDFLVDIKKIKFNLLPLRAKVVGLDLVAKDASFTLSVPNMYIDVSIFSLFMGKPRVGFVQLDDPSLILSPYKKSKSKSLIATKKVKKIPTRLDFEKIFVDEIQVNQGSFIFSSQAFSKGSSPEFYIEKKGIQLNIKFSKRGNFSSNLDIKSVNILKHNKFLVEEASFMLNSSSNGSMIILEHLAVDGKNLDIHGNGVGKIDYIGGTKAAHGIGLNIPLEMKTDLKFLGNFLELEDTSGGVDTSFAIKTYIALPGGRKDGDFKVVGQGQVSEGVLSAYKLFDTRLDYIVDAKGISFEKMELINKERKFGEGRGYIEFDHIDYDFFVQLDHYPLLDILDIIGVKYDGLDFDITSNNLQLNGAGEPFWMKIQALSRLDDFRIPGVEQFYKDQQQVSCQFKIDLNIDNEQLIFNDQSDGKCGVTKKDDIFTKIKDQVFNSDIKVSGHIDFEEGPQMYIVGEKFYFDLLGYFLPIDIRGSGNYKLSIIEKNGQSILSVDFSNEDFYFFDFPLKKTAGTLDITNSHVMLRNITPYLDQGKSFIGGYVDLDSSDFSLNSSAENIGSSILDSFIEKTFQKETSFDVENINFNMNGNLKNPYAANGKADFVIRDLYFEKEKIADKFEVYLTRDSNNIVFNNCGLYLDALGLECYAKIDFADRSDSDRFIQEDLDIIYNDILELNVKSKEYLSNEDKFNLNQLPFFKDYMKNLDARGHLSVESHIGGAFSKLSGQINGKLTNLQIFEEVKVPQFDLKLLFDGEMINLNIDQIGGGFQARYTANIKDDKLPYTFYSKFNQFDLRSVFFSKFANNPRNFLYVDGELFFEGFVTDVWNSKGYFQLDEVHFYHSQDSSDFSNGVELKNEKAFRISTGSKELRKKDQRNLTLTGKHLYASMSFKEVDIPKKVDLSINGEVNLEIFQNIFSDIESSTGLLGFDLKFFGPIDNIDYKLSLKNKVVDKDHVVADPVSFLIPKIRPHFRNILFDIEYSNGIANIKQLFGEKGKGFIDAKGTLVLDKDKTKLDSNLNIELKNMSIFYPVPLLKSIDATLSGDLHITARDYPYSLFGEINIDEASSIRNFNFTKEIVRSLWKSSIKKSPFIKPKKPYVNFDILITATKSIKVNNKTLRLLGSSSIKIEGNDIKPNIIGILSAEGDIFYKRRFYLSHCEINFDDPISNDPFIEIIAYTDIPPYKVNVSISGRASGARVELSVDPPATDEGSVITDLQILYLISHGVLPPTDNISESSSSAGVTEAVNLILEQLPFEKLPEVFELDLIHIYPDLITDDSGSPEIQWNVSIDLYDQIRALVKATSSRSSVALDVTLNKYIGFTGHHESISQDQRSTESQTDTGFDVKFRFSFK